MPRGTHPNSKAALANNRHKGQFTSTTAVINGEKGRTAQHELKSISDELKTLLDEIDEKGKSKRKIMAETILNRAADSPKWFELMLKLANEMPIEEINIRQTPDIAAKSIMLEKLHQMQKEKAIKNELLQERYGNKRNMLTPAEEVEINRIVAERMQTD